MPGAATATTVHKVYFAGKAPAVTPENRQKPCMRVSSFLHATKQ